jgi:hypothetical protein
MKVALWLRFRCGHLMKYTKEWGKLHYWLTQARNFLCDDCKKGRGYYGDEAETKEGDGGEAGSVGGPQRSTDRLIKPVGDAAKSD